ncbi:FkbM family methyltransferase [Hyphobacterium sp.]|uniref:FkbM family methyltransferase n=1 Tax=Hyphobacterium sp. TaxID=2004662 RepID=UPI003748C085
MYKNFIYDEKQGVIFAYVPKVACTNWKSVLRRIGGADDWLDSELAHNREASGLTYLEPDLEAPNLGLPEGAQRFTMVRDPYARTLSAYLNKIEVRLGQAESDRFGHWDKIIAEIELYRQQSLDTTQHPMISFEVFLRWLKESNSWSTRDEHWATQSELLGQPLVKFDFVGRFENINRDSAIILKKMGADFMLPSQAEVRFAPTNAKSRLKTYLTPACRNLIEDIYAADFNNFGFEPLSGRDLVARERQATLKNSLIVNRHTGFVSVSDPFLNEHFIQKHFEKTITASTRRYFRFISNQTLLPQILMGISQHNDGAPVRVFDVGCFMGTFAVAAKFAANSVDVETEVTCVEPNSRILDGLSANLSINKVDGVVIEAAMGKGGTKESLAYQESRMIGARLLAPGEAPPIGSITASVDTISLSDLIPMENTVGLVKLDINGLELAAFRSILMAPSRYNNVFLVRFRFWQLDKEFDRGMSTLDWMLDHFQVHLIKNPILPADTPLGEPIKSLKAFTEPESYVLLVPKNSARQVLGTLPSEIVLGTKR